MTELVGRLSIKSRITLMLIIVSLTASLIIGVLGWRTGHNALRDSITTNLDSISTIKSYQIKNYVDQIFKHMRTLSEDRMVVNAMKQFKEGYNIGLNREIEPEQYAQLDAYYEDEFTQRLASSYDVIPQSVLYKPQRAITSYFQYHYIANNPFPVGGKINMVRTDDDSTIYSRFHAFYHPLFRNLISEHDYFDIFLIDIEGMNVVYTAEKETDFATSLRDGPYRESGLGVLANAIKDDPQRGKISVSDFRPYVPSYGSPASFIGSAIFDGNEAIGILAVQVSIRRINEVMTNNSDWQKIGLGETGESYLVGSDNLLRTITRGYLEDKHNYLTKLRDFGLSEKTLKYIQTFDTTVMMQPVVTDSVTNALNDETGTIITKNYVGESVLSAYTPIDIPGLDWVMVTEIAEQEAFRPMAELQRTIIVWAVVLVLFVAFMAMAISRKFVRPLERLAAGAQALAKDRTSPSIDLSSDDEFGELATHFNVMADRINEQQGQISLKQTENKRLLNNIVPISIAHRLRDGEVICDNLQQVTIACLHLAGFSEWSKRLDAEESGQRLSQLYTSIEEIAERYDVEIVNRSGNTLIAACGLTMTRLDHSKRVLDFCSTTAKMFSTWNTEYKIALALQGGVITGSVTAGVVGTERFNYAIWGETVDVAYQLQSLVAKYGDSINRNLPTTTVQANEDPISANSVLVTQSVYEKVSTFFDLAPYTLPGTESNRDHPSNPLYLLKLSSPSYSAPAQTAS